MTKNYAKFERRMRAANARAENHPQFTCYHKRKGDIWRRSTISHRTLKAAMRRAKATACGGHFQVRVINDRTGAEHDVSCGTRRKGG